MDAADYYLDLPHMPLNVITMILQSMSPSDLFACALVCKAWAEAATAAATRIILRHRIQDLGCLQRWLENHGRQVEVLQLHECSHPAVLTALPCPQLQNLILLGWISLDSRVWSDIAAATKLTCVSLHGLFTESRQADVVSALTALPDLEQLTWSRVKCGRQWWLTDSMLLQKLTKLTALSIDPAAVALNHLGLLSRLQDLSLSVRDNGDWEGRLPWAAGAQGRHTACTGGGVC